MRNIVDECNNTEHNTTKIKPLDAAKQKSHLWVNLHSQSNAKQYRKYPKTNEGDMVRVNIKTCEFSKSHEPNRSSTRYKVVGLKGNQYLIPSINKQKVFLRHELLNV